MKEQINSLEFDIEKFYSLNKRLLRDMAMLNPFQKSIDKIKEDKKINLTKVEQKCMFDYLYNYKNKIETLFIQIMDLKKSEDFIKELSFIFIDIQINGLMKNLYDLRDKKKVKPLITIDELLEFFLNIQFGVFIDKKYIISKVAEYDLELATSSKFSFYLSNVDENVELIDYSNSNGTEKIIFLQRLGVIDFLKEKTLFQTSTNKLAEYLSAVTGERTDTLQSYLNPIINKNVSQKNNPLNTISTVNKVENKLINMGFKDSDLFK